MSPLFAVLGSLADILVKLCDYNPPLDSDALPLRAASDAGFPETENSDLSDGWLLCVFTVPDLPPLRVLLY